MKINTAIFFTPYLILTLAVASIPVKGDDITVRKINSNLQVQHVAINPIENQPTNVSSPAKEKLSGRQKLSRSRRRHKNAQKRAKRMRMLRSEAEQFGISANPSQGTKTLGLQWVIDIRRNLTTLMKGLEQVEQQLTIVKEQLQQKKNSTEGAKTAESQQARSPTTICPWEMLNGGDFNKCYSFHNDRRSWYQSAASCRVVGGRLLRIGSAQETAFLLARAPAWMSSGSAWLTTTWTDGNRLYPCPNDGNALWPSETSWGWGTRLDRLCFDQLVGEQNNRNTIRVYSDWLMSADPQAGACVALAVASTNWEALDCDRPAAYVCERDPVHPQPLLADDNGEGVSSAKITAEQGGGGDDDNYSNGNGDQDDSKRALQPVTTEEMVKESDVDEEGAADDNGETDYESEGATASPEGDSNEQVRMMPDAA